MPLGLQEGLSDMDHTEREYTVGLMKTTGGPETGIER
jgi:hypothetical protein